MTARPLRGLIISPKSRMPPREHKHGIGASRPEMRAMKHRPRMAHGAATHMALGLGRPSPNLKVSLHRTSKHLSSGSHWLKWVS